MRSAPAVRAVVQYVGVWRVSVSCWSLVSGGVGAWWLVGLHDAVHPALLVALVVAVSTCVGLAITTAMERPRMLHWDGQVWRLHGASPGDVCEGRIAATVDLGAWMLLRFDADLDLSTTRRWRFAAQRRWLPVQRSAPEREWHALRCAVHAPQPLGPTA